MPDFEEHDPRPIPLVALTSGEHSWKHCIMSSSPEDLEKQRQYDRNRLKKWYQENKEKKKLYCKEYFERNRERLTTSHDCEICGGMYTLRRKWRHERTKKHQTFLH